MPEVKSRYRRCFVKLLRSDDVSIELHPSLSRPSFNNCLATLSLSLFLSASLPLPRKCGLFSLSMISVMRQAPFPYGAVRPAILLFNQWLCLYNFGSVLRSLLSVSCCVQSLGLFLSFRLQMECMDGLMKLPSYPLRLYATERLCNQDDCRYFSRQKPKGVTVIGSNLSFSLSLSLSFPPLFLRLRACFRPWI